MPSSPEAPSTVPAPHAQAAPAERAERADIDAAALDGARAVRRTARRRAVGLALLAVALGACAAGSLALGAREIPLGTVLEAIAGRLPSDDYDGLVVLTERMPRLLLGVMVGACLGAAGTVMQAVTRNPLADPGILGVEAGAASAVVIGIVVGGVHAPSGYFWFALAGAGVAALAVAFVSRLTTSASPEISLVIAGSAVAALLMSVVTLITIRDEAVFAKLRSWSVGSLLGRGEVIDELWPFAVLALALACTLGRSLDALALGDELAAGLGVRVGPARIGAVGVGVLLAAVATAAIGPVAFVGLVAAHVARLIVGPEHRWLLPYSMLTGALMLLAADVAARLVPGRGELEVGIMTAVVGTPFFVALARGRKRVSGL